MESFLSGSCPIRLNVSLPEGPGPHPAILLLHGAGGNVDFWLDQIAPLITRLGIAVFAVHYFDRTGTTRADLTTITDGRHVPLWLSTVQDALTNIAARPTVDSERIALVGISLGAYLSLAVPTQPGSLPIRAIVEICGGLVEPYVTLARPTFPPTLILHGDQDQVVPVSNAHTLVRTLTRLNVEHESKILTGETHFFSPGAQLRILTSTATFLGRYLSRRKP